MKKWNEVTASLLILVIAVSIFGFFHFYYSKTELAKQRELLIASSNGISKEKITNPYGGAIYAPDGILKDVQSHIYSNEFELAKSEIALLQDLLGRAEERQTALKAQKAEEDAIAAAVAAAAEKAKLEEEKRQAELKRLAAQKKTTARITTVTTATNTGTCSKNEYYIVTNVRTNYEYLYQGDPDCRTGEVVRTFRVATGRQEYLWNPSGWWYWGGTPTGKWRIISKEARSSTSIYGPWFLRLHYLAGGYVDSYALHGTDEPATIGTWASHGCTRHYNEDIIYLNSVLRVGTTVWTVN